MENIIYISDAKSSIASSGTIKNHKKQGLWTSYYESGEVLSKSTFKDGYLNGRCSEYTKAGKLVFEAEFLYSQLNGTVYHFDPGYIPINSYCSKGQLHREFLRQYGQFTYLNGRRNGAASFKEKNEYITCFYKYGKLHGDVIYKNSFNQLFRIYKYDHGKYLSTEKYESLTNETTYSYSLFIMPERYPETLESLKQKLTKLDSCHNLHYLSIHNYSTEISFDSIIQEYIVSIPKFKHLTLLNLGGKGFSQIPSAIFDCTSLKNLKLEDISMTELSNRITNLKALETLTLGLSRFQNIEKLIRQISKLRNLKEFTLYDWLGSFPKDNIWKEASELIVGDTLLILNESSMTLNKVRINKIGVIKNVNQVFNISTSKNNYFANGILVHNK